MGAEPSTSESGGRISVCVVGWSAGLSLRLRPGATMLLVDDGHYYMILAPGDSLLLSNGILAK